MSEHLIERARVFAVAAHSAVGQVRKGTGEPYWHHCRNVAQRVWKATQSPEATAAAWLHDVLEDTKVTAGAMEAEFGPEVTSLVLSVTDVSRAEDGNRAARKAKGRAHNARAPALGQTIKVADLIDNCASIIAHDPAFAGVYMGEMAKLLDVLVLAEPGLLEEATHRLREWQERRLQAALRW